MNHDNCTTIWHYNRDPTRQCPNCEKVFRLGERVRISSSGILTVIICANGSACDRRERAETNMPDVPQHA